MCAMMAPGAGGRVAVGDREIVEDILATEKYVTDLYSKATVEATDQQFRNSVQQIQTEMQHNAKRVFDYMAQKGWYPTPAAPPDRINQLRSTVDESRRTIQQFSQQAGITSGPVFGGFQAGAGYGAGYGPAQLPGWARTEPAERGAPAYGGAWGQPAGTWGGYGGGMGYQAQIPQWARQETAGWEKGPGGAPGGPGTGGAAGAGFYGGQAGGYAMQQGLPEWARSEPPQPTQRDRSGK